MNTRRAGKAILALLAVLAMLLAFSPLAGARPGVIRSITVNGVDYTGDGGNGQFPDCDFTIGLTFDTVRKSDWTASFQFSTYNNDELHYMSAGSGSATIAAKATSVTFPSLYNFVGWQHTAANLVVVTVYKQTRNGPAVVDVAQTPVFMSPATGCITGSTTYTV